MTMSDDLEVYLRELATGNRLYFYPNHGNAGDSLIAFATYRLFEKLGIDYRIIDNWQEFNAHGKTVVYGGGGNLAKSYREARDFIQAHHESAHRLVVLPHTVNGHAELLRRLGNNVEILCREAVSYRYLQRQSPHLKCRLMHDLAFTIDVRDILGTRGKLPTGPLARRWWRDTRRDWRWRLVTPRRFKTGVLNAFRTDGERSNPDLPERNIDVSRRFAFDAFDPVATAYVTRRLLTFIDRFEVIRTDRLHVCIAAAFLNKDVEFYANNYYKCEAVWLHSMKGRFNNVRWMDTSSTPT